METQLKNGSLKNEVNFEIVKSLIWKILWKVTKLNEQESSSSGLIEIKLKFS